MWLIIAVIMLVIYGSIRAYDGLGNVAYNAKIKANETEHDAFVKKYVDKELDEKLEKFRDNEVNFPVVQAEVNKALAEMPHWEPVRYHSDVYLKRFVAHIMAANRGKVSEDSAVFGIMTPWDGSGRDEDRYKSYEFVEWIQKTLAKQGVYVTPVLIGYPGGHSKYYWTGSREEVYGRYKKERGEYHEFSPELLPNRPVNVPAPYYDKGNSNVMEGKTLQIQSVPSYTHLPPPLPDAPMPESSKETAPPWEHSAVLRKLIECSSHGKDTGAIFLEVKSALETLPHWSKSDYYRNLTKENIFENCSVLDELDPVRNIILANRGEASSCKYEIKFFSGDTNAALMQYELLEWVQKTLAKKGIKTRLVCVPTGKRKYTLEAPVYQWVEVEAFDRDVIEFDEELISAYTHQNSPEDKAKQQSFWEKYVDEALEAEIDERLDDPHNQKSLQKEIFPYMKRIEFISWDEQDNKELVFSYAQTNLKSRNIITLYRNLAKYILLAKDGKIYSAIAKRGYRANLLDMEESRKTLYYGIADMVRNVLEENGVKLNLWHKTYTLELENDVYVFEGSPAFYNGRYTGQDSLFKLTKLTKKYFYSMLR